LLAFLMMPDCRLVLQKAARFEDLFLTRLQRRNELVNRITKVWIMALVAAGAATGCKPKPAGGSGMGGMPAIQVVAVDAKLQPVTESLSLVGTITPKEMVEIKAETDGIVQDINFKEGQRVEQGQLLVSLDETKSAAALAQVEANLKLSEANFERAKQLFKDKLVSQQEYEQSAATHAVNQASVDLQRRLLKDARINAPFGGIVGARQISPGQVIARSMVLTWLVDLDTVKVEVNVPERYLQELKVGRSLEFTVAAFPAEKFHGEVYFVSPQVNENLRTALIKARIANPDHKLLGGMFASLELTLKVRDSAIVIPEPAIMSNGDNFSVFVVDKDGNAQLRPIQVGLRLAGKAEVLKGLNAGDKVVVEGVQKLRPGGPVKLSPPEAAAPYVQN
jgi:membrane fusion protein (multidrug efflux system)